MSTDPDHIEETIETTRARLSQNLGELGDRMSPGNLVDEALSYFDSGPKEVAGSLGNQVRENPMAALLTVAGVAWMAFGRGQDPARRYADPRHPRYEDPYAAGQRAYSRFDRDDNDDDWDDDDRTYSRLDTDHIPSGGPTYRDTPSSMDADMDADYSTAETHVPDGPYGGYYDLPEEDVTTYRSSLDTYESVNRVRTSTTRNEGETDSAYYRRLDDSYASTLRIERNDGEDDDTYRARVRSAVDTASDKANEARRSLKRSARNARRRMAEMRRNAGQGLADFGDEASRRAAEYRDEAAYRARLAKRRAGEFHDENPLVSGALALAAGALAGALFPVTDKEREALKPVADDLITRGAELAEQGAERVEAYADKVEGKAEELRDASIMRDGTTA